MSISFPVSTAHAVNSPCPRVVNLYTFEGLLHPYLFLDSTAASYIVDDVNPVNENIYNMSIRRNQHRELVLIKLWSLTNSLFECTLVMELRFHLPAYGWGQSMSHHQGRKSLSSYQVHLSPEIIWSINHGRYTKNTLLLRKFNFKYNSSILQKYNSGLWLWDYHGIMYSMENWYDGHIQWLTDSPVAGFWTSLMYGSEYL